MRLAYLLFSTGFLVVTQAQPRFVFDAASVKPARPSLGGGQKGVGSAAAPVLEADHLTFRARSLHLYGLIIRAYGLAYCRPGTGTCPQLSGAPAWFTKDAFDIEARSPAESKQYTTIQLMNGQAPELQEELRNLLADRFHLKAHFEERQLPVYAITVAEGGIRIKASTADGSHSVVFQPVEPSPGAQATQLIAVRSTLREVADLYARFMDRPVIDATGLTGRYDFTVQYEADPDGDGPFAAATSHTLFEAFEKQAGLKLRATRGPVKVLVIDSASRPTAN